MSDPKAETPEDVEAHYTERLTVIMKTRHSWEELLAAAKHVMEENGGGEDFERLKTAINALEKQE